MTDYYLENLKPMVFKSAQKVGYDLETTEASSISIGTFSAKGANAIAILWS